MERRLATRPEKLKKTFRRQMILTLGEVADLIQSSIHTARRRLKEWGALSSCNQNARYYVLPDVPDFNGNGLWRCRDVLFSRYGNLKQTVIELVRQSQAGLDAGEMRSLLGLEPRSFLSAFAKQPELRREKIKGRFVYFCSDESVYDKQHKRRLLLHTKGQQPTPIEAVAILVEKIKHPTLSNAALARRLRKQHLHVDLEVIQNLFVLHDLALKKTPHSI